jgi:hypothetical protein
MGRIVTSFSYPQHSAMDHIMRRIRESNKNVSEVITDIITNHYELYDQVQHLTEQLQQQAQQHSHHRAAAETAGLKLNYSHYGLGWNYRKINGGEEE